MLRVMISTWLNGKSYICFSLELLQTSPFKYNDRHFLLVYVFVLINYWGNDMYLRVDVELLAELLCRSPGCPERQIHNTLAL